MQLTRDQIQEAVKKHGSQRKAAKALGIAQSTLSYAMSGRSARETSAPHPTLPPGRSAGRSLSEFRQTHDKNFIVPKKIKDALAALGQGWDYEQPFARLAGISLGDLSAYRPMFEDHIVMVDKSKRAWAGTKATADKMRAMVM